MFPYFYGNESEQYLFYSVPQLLFTKDIFRKISCEAKLLYSFLLDRTSLSRKNKWYDDDGKLFVYFKQEELCEKLNIGKDKAVKVFNELDSAKGGIGLIERKKQGQGKPIKIYVKNFTGSLSEEPHKDSEVLTSENPKSENSECEVRVKAEVLTSEKPKSKPRKIRSLDCGKSEVLPISHIKRTILSESYPIYPYPTSPTAPKSEVSVDMDRIDADGYADALETISEQVDAASLLQITNRKTGLPMYDNDTVQELVELIAWVYTTPQKTMPINGVALSIDIIRSQFHKLDSEHLAYILDSLRNNCAKIKNRRNYLLTCLFNAPSTMSGYYQNQVQHDLSITDASIESRSSPNVYAQLVEKN